MIHHEIHQQTHQTELPNEPRFVTLATLAIVAQVLLLTSAWLLPTVSEFSVIGDNISELVLGHFGVIQTAAFLFVGVVTVGLAYAIRHFTAGLRGSWAGSLLVALNGIGLILIAFFPTDRIDTPADVWAQSTTGTIHLIVSIVTFLCIIVGMFVLTWTFARSEQWRSLALASGLLASGSLALFFVQSEGPWVGLMQRLLVLLIESWLMLVAFRIRSLAKSAEVSERHNERRQTRTGEVERQWMSRGPDFDE
jgi:hypothetical protein